jgi:acyl carrier protein phosphodiesterase
MAGSMAGDFIHGPLPERHTPFLEGVRFHREVDAFTDDHLVVQRTKSLFRPPHRRYAGVLVDIFYDHCLARRWSEFAGAAAAGTLEEFAAHVSGEIAAHHAEFPHRARPFIDFFLRTNLLLSYREREGISRALEGMSRRMKRPNPLASGMGEIEARYVQLERGFLEFFPEAIALARRARPSK